MQPWLIEDATGQRDSRKTAKPSFNRHSSNATASHPSGAGEYRRTCETAGESGCREQGASRATSRQCEAVAATGDLGVLAWILQQQTGETKGGKGRSRESHRQSVAEGAQVGRQISPPWRRRDEPDLLYSLGGKTVGIEIATAFYHNRQAEIEIAAGAGQA